MIKLKLKNIITMRKITIIIASALLMFSCQKENNYDFNKEAKSNSAVSFEDYLSFLKNETDNKILIQSYGSPNSDRNAYYMSGNSLTNGTSFSINKEDYSISSNGHSWGKSFDDLSKYYGQTVKVALNANQSNKATSEIVSEFYIPQNINAQFINLENDKVKAGTKVQWNADTKNQNGVILAVEYRPIIQLVPSVKEEMPRHFIKGITMEDNGTYTISAQDLAEFPNEANLTFIILRAGFDVNADFNHDLTAGAYTMCKSIMQISK